MNLSAFISTFFFLSLINSLKSDQTSLNSSKLSSESSVNSQKSTMSLSSAFTKEQLIPDLLDSVPDKVLKISYNSGVKLEPGNVLTPTQVKDQPTVEYEAEDGAFYTLLMTDLDAPSRAVSIEFGGPATSAY